MKATTSNTSLQIVIRSKSTGLYYVSDKGFSTSHRSEASKYYDCSSMRAWGKFIAHSVGAVQFISDSQYADGAASLPTTPLTQAEIDADVAEKKTWLPWPTGKSSTSPEA